MDGNYVAEVAKGYAQSGAGAIDTAQSLNILTFGNLGTAGIPFGTALLVIQPQGQAIRWRDDGIAPTAAVGYPLAVGAELRYTGSKMGQLQVISQTAGAVINVVAYAQGGT